MEMKMKQALGIHLLEIVYEGHVSDLILGNAPRLAATTLGIAPKKKGKVLRVLPSVPCLCPLRL